MYNLEGVYWDLDGTIANTELEAHLPAFNKSFDALDIGWHWDEKTYIDLLKINGGKNRISYYAKLKKQNPTCSFFSIVKQKKSCALTLKDS